METSNQLALLNFNEMPIAIYGTKEEPLFKCSDILIHILQYRDSNDAKWYRTMKNDNNFIIPGEMPGQYYFTEIGLYKALMKSNKPLAEQFQLKVCLLLKNMRIQTQKQLEEAMKEIEELKQPKIASIYVFKYNNRILYVGKDKSKLQNRPQQHLTERRKIAQNHQLIDIFLATIPENEIVIENHLCNDYEADGLEHDYIQDLEPEYNQSMNKRIYECPYCNPPKQYKSRGPYEKHLTSCILLNTHI